MDLPTLGDIEKTPNGRAVVKDLIAAGVERKELESAIKFVMFVQIMPPPGRLHDVKGLSRKSLPLFSQELRRAATRIELVRKNPLYGMFLNLFLPGPHWEQTCDYLREYANWLDILIPAFRKGAEDNPREYDLRLFSKRRFMAEVAKATGTPHCDLVAQVLNVAYDVAGLQLSEDQRGRCG